MSAVGERVRPGAPASNPPLEARAETGGASGGPPDTRSRRAVAAPGPCGGRKVSRRRFVGEGIAAAAALSISAIAAPFGRAGPAPRIKVALAGDTMLGRGVAAALRSVSPESLFSGGVVEAAREADLFVLNLECCISTRGSPWAAPGKPFFFRAPPVALEVLTHLGVDCVTLANNHALDFGYEALLDTFDHLRAAGIPWVGAGPDLERARAPLVLETNGFRLKVLGVTDHPRDFAATADLPGVAFADLRKGVPAWLTEALSGPAERPLPEQRGGPAETDTGGGTEAASGGRADAHAILLTPHWGPNMTLEPPRYVRAAAAALRGRATLIAGHSAHVFHGVQGNVLYDLGDFLDDYARDPILRNDLGLLFIVTLDAAGPRRIEALPLKLEYCYTRLAEGDDAAWIRRRFIEACVSLGTHVREEGGRLVIDPIRSAPAAGGAPGRVSQ